MERCCVMCSLTAHCSPHWLWWGVMNGVCLCMCAKDVWEGRVWHQPLQLWHWKTWQFFINIYMGCRTPEKKDHHLILSLSLFPPPNVCVFLSHTYTQVDWPLFHSNIVVWQHLAVLFFNAWPLVTWWSPIFWPSQPTKIFK